MELSWIRRHALWLLAALALAFGGAIAAKRTHAAFSQTLPVQTTGCEEDSFYAVWRAKHGLPVYTDPFSPPYSASYFNWLFYRTYAAAARLGEDRDIPKIGRGLTLAGLMLAAGLVWRIGGGGRWALLAALTLPFGNFFGWWAVTVRPDVWATALELAAAAVFLALWRRHPRASVFSAVLLAWLAWSFKQPNISVLGGLVLFLLCRRRWALAALAAGFAGLLFAGTFVVAGEGYRQTMREVAASGVEFPRGWNNTRDALLRGLPVLLLPLLAVGRGRLAAAGDDLRFLWCALLVSVLIAFPAAFKAGASHNYYFTVFCLAAALGLRAAKTISAPGPRAFPWREFTITAGALAALALAGLQWSGRVGKLDLDPEAALLAKRIEAWRGLPEPKFSFDRRLALPWVEATAENFVVAFNYDFDRARARAFEHDGIGGLIRTGYFRGLAIPAGWSAYDGADLTPRYRLVRRAADLDFYERREPAP